MACVDTTVLLDLVGRGGRKARQAALAKLRELLFREERLLTTRFNAAELYVGIHKAQDPQEEQLRVRGALRVFGILRFNDAAAREYGRVTAYLHRIGRPVGDMDVLIAATALVAGQRLVTRNAKHYRDIPGLVVEGY